ncbi:MAG: ORF6N domain-containing protein [Salinivirgaceae bacterium]|nr:ORF6N domain-containing protein [Salinivirgaceae bacterium]
MTEEKNSIIMLPDEVVMTKIFIVRGQKVMIDRDLAELYGVETRVLKQTVRRNIERFPEDFMFEMSKEEFVNWRSQFVTSNSDKQGLRYAPFCFTEQGVTMLSCTLNSKRAIQLNIQIVRIFTKIREVLTDTLSLKIDIEDIKKKLENQDKNIELVFTYLDKLMEKHENRTPRKRIGFKKDNH